MNSFAEVFDVIKKYCLNEGQLVEAAYNLWIRPIEAKELDGNNAVLYVPSEFQKSVIQTNYEKLLKEAFKAVLGFDVKIQIHTEDDDYPPKHVSFDEIEERHLQLEKSFETAKYDYTFDTFIVGRSNEFAYAACTAVAKGNGATYNPLFMPFRSWKNSSSYCDIK